MAEAKDKKKEDAKVAESEVPTSDDAARSTTHVAIPAQNGNGVVSVEERGVPGE